MDCFKAIVSAFRGVPRPEPVIMAKRQGLQVIIVGGGIGGLAAAIAILLAGHSVIVLEMADKIEEVSI